MSPARSTPFLLLLASLSLTACGSSSLGRMPESIVELYDLADPAGGMELELERDGTLIEVEADVPLESVPDHLIQAVYASYPGALLQGAEREITGAGRMWEVKFKSMGREYELVFDDEGTVRESEMSLTWAEVPPAVLEAADAALPGGVPVSAEVITMGETQLYHIKKNRDGARYKIVLDERPRVVRLVREQRAEIEIPLAY